MIELNEPYGFIYITTNLLNGKRYIGKKTFDKKGMWKSYLGSGVALKQALKKYGKNHFSKVIISIAYNNNQLCDLEKKYISLYNATESTDFYNIASGGEGYNFFGSTDGNRSRSVYCIELKQAFKNCIIASDIIGENDSTIYNKCKHQKSLIRNGYHWCFTDNMYSKCEMRGSSRSEPVVYLGNNKVYSSWNVARKMINNNIKRRSVITYDRYIKMVNKGKYYQDRLLKLEDFFKIQDFTI